MACHCLNLIFANLSLVPPPYSAAIQSSESAFRFTHPSPSTSRVLIQKSKLVIFVRILFLQIFRIFLTQISNSFQAGAVLAHSSTPAFSVRFPLCRRAIANPVVISLVFYLEPG